VWSGAGAAHDGRSKTTASPTFIRDSKICVTQRQCYTLMRSERQATADCAFLDSESELLVSQHEYSSQQAATRRRNSLDAPVYRDKENFQCTVSGHACTSNAHSACWCPSLGSQQVVARPRDPSCPCFMHETIVQQLVLFGGPNTDPATPLGLQGGWCAPFGCCTSWRCPIHRQ
jgi:hypothetical protein